MLLHISQLIFLNTEKQQTILVLGFLFIFIHIKLTNKFRVLHLFSQLISQQADLSLTQKDFCYDTQILKKIFHTDYCLQY